MKLAQVVSVYFADNLAGLGADELLQFFLAGAQAVVAGHNGVVRGANGETIQGEAQSCAFLFDAPSDECDFTFQECFLLSRPRLVHRKLFV